MMINKNNQGIRYICLFCTTVLVVFAGCSQEKLPEESIYLADTSIAVSVFDGGYKGDENLQTRTVENSYTTVFTADDKIGVYAVKDGTITDEVNNVCLIAANNGSGGIEWRDISGKILRNISGATYYAYYPYNSSLKNSHINVHATEAEEFFASFIAAWTPATDQGTYTDYTSQDLMVAKGNLSGSNLSFSMEHCMGLIVIDLPKIKNSLSTPAPDTEFKDFIPYYMNDGLYRYLVKPYSDRIFSGSYTQAIGFFEWKFSANIAKGTYKTYTIDGGGFIETK